MSVMSSNFSATVRVIACSALLAMPLGPGGAARGAEARPPSGLAVTFNVGDQTDITTAPAVALYVEAGKSPTPFLSGASSPRLGMGR